MSRTPIRVYLVRDMHPDGDDVLGVSTCSERAVSRAIDFLKTAYDTDHVGIMLSAVMYLDTTSREERYASKQRLKKGTSLTLYALKDNGQGLMPHHPLSCVTIKPMTCF